MIGPVVKVQPPKLGDRLMQQAQTVTTRRSTRSCHGRSSIATGSRPR